MPPSLNDELDSILEQREALRMPEMPQWINMTASSNGTIQPVTANEYIAQYQAAFEEAMTPPEPTNAYELRWNEMQANHMRLNEMYWPSASDRDRAMGQYTEIEGEFFKEFMATGMSNEIEMFLTRKKELFVYGQTTMHGDKVCVITPRLIKASKTRAKHLKKLLTALARREGLELSMVDELPELPDNSTPVMCWKWKVREEVDDSKLLVTQPREGPNPPATASSSVRYGNLVELTSNYTMSSDTPF